MLRYEIYATNEDNDWGISAIGYGCDPKITRFGPGQRNLFIIHYVLKGKGYFNHTCVKKGQGFLITPQMQEHYFPDETEPWEFIWIIFEAQSNADKLFQKYGADFENNRFEYGNLNTLLEAKDYLIKHHSKLYCPSELYEMFLHIFNRHNITPKQADSETTYYNYAVGYIHTNLFRKLTIRELTDFLGVSQPYLYRIFIKKTSVSPKEYIQMQKLKTAKELLLKSAMEITQIANSIGMDDCITFSKFFKLQTGMSPTEFRKTFLEM